MRRTCGSSGAVQEKGLYSYMRVKWGLGTAEWCRSKLSQQANDLRLCLRLRRTGELRLGVWMDFGGDYGGSYKFRHWGCVSERQFANMNLVYSGDPSLMPGFDALDLEDQHMVRKAFEVGAGEFLLERATLDSADPWSRTVAEEDLSELAPARSKAKKPAKASRSKKRAAYEDDDEDYEDKDYGKGDSGGHTTSDALGGDVKEDMKPEVKPELEEVSGSLSLRRVQG